MNDVPSRFEDCLAFTLAQEGGYVDNPHDPGGATNKGITQVTYSRWLRLNSLPFANVKEIPDDHVKAIYLVEYWNAVKCSRFAAGVDLCVFDWAVNSGVGAVHHIRIGANIDNICDERLHFLRHLSTFHIFGKGWTRRVNACRIRAKEMARSLSASELNVSGSGDNRIA